MKKTIWAQVVIRNEENFIWFAIMSVIDYVDRLVIYDLGSTDKTVEIIKTIKSDKIALHEFNGNFDMKALGQKRQEMLEASKCDWIMLLDGDEIWLDHSIQMVRELIDEKGDQIENIVTPFKMLLGDIYHYQEESGGQYQIGGKKGHYTLRFINRKLPGLHVETHQTAAGLWREGYYDLEDKLVYERDPSKMVVLEAPYLHASHLARSSQDAVVFERPLHYKYEIGLAFSKAFKFPSAFDLPYPKLVKSPMSRMSTKYRLRALLETPLKKVKRRLTG